MAPRLVGLLLLSAALLAPSAEGAERAKGKRVKAELGVASVGAPTTAVAGSSFSAAFDVANRGRKTAKASSLEIVLSSNGARDGGDTVLATAAINKIKRKEAAGGQVQVTMPSTPGAFLLIACADSARKVKEKSETNNCRTSDAFTITEPVTSTSPPGPLTWSLRNSNSAGAADVTFDYGTEGQIPLAGDWDGNGTDTPGTFDPTTNVWSLRNSNSAGAPSASFTYGPPGAIPVTGDWDGDGDDTAGYFEPATGTWGLKNLLSGGVPDLLFSFGGSGALTPVTGDWDGNGLDTIGVKLGSQRILRDANSSGSANYTFPYGTAADKPFSGDWNGNGTETPGFFSSGSPSFGLRNANTAGAPDITFSFGNVTDTPLAGDWNGDGTDTVGTVG